MSAERLNPHVRDRITQLANRIMELDKKYHVRHAELTNKGTHPYNIKNDPLLKEYSGATNTLSGMCTALSLAYMIHH